MSFDFNIELLVTAAVAVSGFVAKYLNDLRLEKNGAEIKLISDQVQYLYGPLSALSAANEAAWKTFTGKYFPDNPAVFGEKPLSDRELALWRQWMTEIFMPMNRAMVDIILKNAHLIDGSDFPKPFSELISHVKTYEIVLSDWAKGNLVEHSAFTSYPTDINDYARDKFKMIKARQADLLN